MLKTVIGRVFKWFLCKIQLPMYSPSLTSLLGANGELICAHCHKHHGNFWLA